jgi:hypothetical protein
MFTLLMGGASFAQAADETSPGSSPEQSPPASGDVQERGFQRQLGRPLAPISVLPKPPSGFYCIKSKNTCYCDRSTKGDCELMQDIACSPNTYKDTTVLDGECKAWTN